MRTVHRTAVVALGLLGLVATACGGGSSGGATPAGGTTSVAVELKEWTVTAAPSSVAAGTVRVTAKNAGTVDHEFVVLKTDLAPDALPTSGGKVHEGAAGIQQVGEIEVFGAGKTESQSFDLSAGTYVLICNVAGHYQQGMRTAFEVR